MKNKNKEKPPCIEDFTVDVANDEIIYTGSKPFKGVVCMNLTLDGVKPLQASVSLDGNVLTIDTIGVNK